MRTSVASEHRLDRPVSRDWWAIEVAGYGGFAFYGTEDEAEDMRVHKASWEGGTATKRHAEWSDPLVQDQAVWAKHEMKLGYPRSSEREQAETAAIVAANAGNNLREPGTGERQVD